MATGGSVVGKTDPVLTRSDTLLAQSAAVVYWVKQALRNLVTGGVITVSPALPMDWLT